MSANIPDERRGLSPPNRFKRVVCRCSVGINPTARRTQSLLALCVALALTAHAHAAQIDPDDPDELPAAPKVSAKKMRFPAPVAKSDESLFTGSLTEKDPVEPGHGYRKTHRVRLDSERIYEIDLSSPELVNPFVILRNADGTPLKNVADLLTERRPGTNYVFAPEKTGDYELVVTTRDSGSIGDYTVSIRPVESEHEVRRLPPVEAGDIVVTPLQPLLSDEPTTTHGYIEYRFLVQNKSDKQDHRVTVQLPRFDDGRNWGTYIRSMRKSATLGPRSDVQLSLFQPYVRLGSIAVALEIDGRPVPAANLQVDVAGRRATDQDRGGGRRVFGVPQVLWLNTGQKDRLFFQRRSVVLGLGRGGEKAEAANHRVADLPLGKWSDNCLGLGQYDGICVPGKALEAAPDGVQSALWQYVETGGTLLVLGPCNRLPWTAPAKVAGMKIHRSGFGVCVMTEVDDVRKLDARQWEILDGLWQQSSRPWSQITNASDAHRIFPVVDNVEIPIRGLCAFMLAFVIAIGPVNMYILSRLRRRIWLLWTVPVVSLLTTGLLFLYVAVTDGWRPHVRANILTVLDERTQRASSIGWLGYYSPTTSGSGLRFGLDTELSPHFESTGRGGRWGRGDEMERSLTIDWTDDQHLEAGWLTAKVPLHFLVRRSHKQQERLQVRLADGALYAVNGLGTDVDKLWVADRDGLIHEATAVKAGVEAKLAATAMKATDKADMLREGYAGNWLKTTETLEANPERYLRPGCYIAVTKEMPFVDAGIEHTQTKKLHTVVYGILKDVP